MKERTEGLLPNLSERLKGSALCCGKTLPAAGFTKVVKDGWHCWYPEKGAMYRRLLRRTMTFTEGIQSAWDQLGAGETSKSKLPWFFCSSASVSRGLNPSSNFMREEETHCIWKYTFQSLLFLVKENFASSTQGKIKSHSQVCHWNETNFVIFSSIIYNICISCFGNVLRIPSNIRPGEAEVGRSLSLRPAWAIQ